MTLRFSGAAGLRFRRTIRTMGDFCSSSPAAQFDFLSSFQTYKNF
jgi:hypothetical protein